MSTDPNQHTPASGGDQRPRRGERGRGSDRNRARKAPHSASKQGTGKQRAGKQGAGGPGASGRHAPARGRHQVSTQQLERLAAIRAGVELPAITYPEQLPVSAHRAEISRAIADHQVVIVAGETGSGKTTQLPKILLELGRGRTGQIGHTQPRRIAARTVAERIGEELGVGLGGVVGYQVRFTDASSDETLVKVMTDGIMLAQIQRDPRLLAYDAIIIDEAHERSLNIDFLLGYLSRLLPTRPDLKLVITSATIDSQRFAEHFSPAHLAQLGGAPPIVVDALPDAAPVVEVSGRTFPVEIRYRPLTLESKRDEDERSLGLPSAPLVPHDAPARPATAFAERTSTSRAKQSGRTSGQGGKASGADDRSNARGSSPTATTGERDLMTGIVDACQELMLEGPGDILVFLSGEREIHDAADALEGALGERTRDNRRPDYVEILPLYARLSAAEQHRVFHAHAGRRIVLATNVAETSLTVPGIHYVVDPGTARISRYSKATKVQRLPIEAVSQASANQRSGRSGRVADGIAIRLYSQEDFEARPPFTEPEILRTSLASVLLQMISVGVVDSPDDVASFPFVEPPDTRAVRDGVALLTELGALEPGKANRLTETGRVLAQLPMDPRLARMIWEASKLGVAREVAIIAAALSIQDPRERPVEFRAQADQLHARFTDPRSDFLTYLNLWEYLRESRYELSSSAFRRMCKAQYINFLRVREWQDLVTQLRDMGKPLGITMKHRRDPSTQLIGPAGDPRTPNSADLSEAGAAEDEAGYRLRWDADTIHRALLAGLLSHIGMQVTGEVKASSVAHLRGAAREKTLKRATRQARNEYVGSRGAKFAIFPGSALAKKPPTWVMAGELVETSRLWARDVAHIQPEWAEALAGDLAKRSYSDPHWSTKRGAAVAREKVQLYGVPIVTDRNVLFAKVDQAAAREMFIRHALVGGEWTTHHKFFADNQAKLAEAQELEARSRQRGLVVDDDVLFDFYDERIPADIVSARHFDTWWKAAKRENPDLLTLDLAQLIPAAAEIDTTAFPQTWTQGDIELALSYQFEPGTAADGVTVHIPISVLNRVHPDGFDWMVPGLLDELATATIRSLPKAVRVQLVPAPDVARDVVHWLHHNTPTWEDMARAGDMAEPFHASFTAAVRDLRGVVIPAEVWDSARTERLPAHLRMTFRIESPDAGVLGESKDLLGLQRRLAPRAQAAVSAAVKGAVGRALQEAAAAAKAKPQVPVPHAPNTTPNTPAANPTPPQPSGPEALPTASAPASPATPSTLVAEDPNLPTWPTSLGEDPLPQVISTNAGNVVVHGYPAIVVETGPKGATTVALRVLADHTGWAARHATGVRRLLLSETALATGRVTSRWSTAQSLMMAASPYRNTEALVADLQLAAVTALTAGGKGQFGALPDAAGIGDLAGYQAARDLVRRRLEDQVHVIVGHVVAALTAWREIDGRLSAMRSLAMLNTATDLRDHVSALVSDGFITTTPPDRLAHLTRYLRAASYRLDKATENPNRDAELAWRVHDVEDAYSKARAAYVAGPANEARAAELASVRWLIEELRVSLFAQQLGTDGPISEKRIRKILDPKVW